MLRVFLYIIILLIRFFYDIIMTRKIQNNIYPVARTHGIQHIIFRTYSKSSLKLAMYRDCHLKWQQLNPSFSIIWFNNKNCDNFIRKMYDKNVFNTYVKLKPGAYKADLWRLCVLYRYGGVYVDAFATPYISIQKMIKNCINKGGKKFISVLDSKSSGGGIHNGFMITEPRHPFIKQAIKDIIKNVKENYYGENPLDVTGPLALSKSIIKLCGKKHVVGWNRYKNLSYYLYRFEYGPYQNIFKGSTKILSKYFSFAWYLYRKLYRTDGYHKMWHNKDIYNKI